jgi:hypothetical protein
MGDTFSQAFTVMENGLTASPQNDTWKIRIEDAASGAEFLTLTNGSGIAFPGAGVVRWTLTPANTAVFVPKRRYQYDIQRTKSDGSVKTIQRGEMIPHKDITTP